MIFGDPPSNWTASWRPEPQYRGTFNILSTCVITLSLCVWTSVHLNIPEHDRAPKRKWYDPRRWISRQQWRKVGWLIIGLLAPETVAFTAWSQRRQAADVTVKMKKFLGKFTPDQISHPPECSNRDIEMRPTISRRSTLRVHEWTTVHSFYTVMGGFVFDTSDVPSGQKFLPGSRERVTISSEGVLFLAEHRRWLIPDISKAEILDKSNANGLAKAIVCLQAIWFCTQCISRLAQGLSISFLELNTFAHAICALLAYALWWSKPLDIGEPTSIKGPGMHGICAFLCMANKFDDYPELEKLKYNEGVEPSPVICLPHSAMTKQLHEHATLEQGQIDRVGQISSSEHSKGSPFETRYRSISIAQPQQAPKMKLYMGQSINGFCYSRKILYGEPAHRYSAESGILGLHREYLQYSSSDERRWFLASQFLEQSPELWNLVTPNDLQSLPALRYGLQDRIKNWPQQANISDIMGDIVDGEFYFLSVGYTWTFFAFALAGVLYGGLHLLAWNAPFASATQNILWRVSGIVIAASGPVVVAYFLFFALLRVLLKSIDPYSDL